MALPSNHVAPDVQAQLVADIATALRANATYLGAAQKRIQDTPIHARDEDVAAQIEIFAVSEAETFPNAGYPRSDQTEAVVGIVATVSVKGAGWMTTLRLLRARIRAVLLQDPAFAWWGCVTRIDTAMSFDGEGKLIAGTALLTVTFEYQSDYPPLAADPLAGIDIDVTLPSNADQPPTLRIVIDLPQPE